MTHPAAQGDVLQLFAPRSSAPFGEAVARALGTALSPLEERDFEDGEHKIRPLVGVRGRDVYVVHSLYGETGASVNDKLCRLLFLLGALGDGGARSVTAVVPYLCYSRKDRRTQPRDPVTTRYVAGLFEAVGTSRVVTLDVHNLAAFQNAFRCSTEHLEARSLFVEYFAPRLTSGPVVVVSPDAGGVKRAERLREGLARRLAAPVGMAFLEKRRALGVVSGDALVGDVRDATAVIVDDLVTTGTTLGRAAGACRAAGARAVHAAATHAVFLRSAADVVAKAPLDSLVVTNSVAPGRITDQRLVVLDAAPLVAEAIRRLHTGGSLVELLEDGGAPP